MQRERRYAELTAAGDNTLAGVVMLYGAEARIAGRFKERFDSGAFANIGDADILLNVQHDRTRPLARTGGGGLVLTDSVMELRMQARLPETREAKDTLSLVRGKVLRGLSVEFLPTAEHDENGVRVIERALLTGLSVVDKPAYDSSTVAARWLEPRNYSVAPRFAL